ncbi:hypothetical protein [Candidatus Thiosymbion oneisti]|uniref:hypothetical protein n=1 Tax=Candidatus Thiosymbion oneisti TaxID=589554 RepID=UPI000B7E008C|nr:hypothetical protein [Candidatus Thiosymbion oneisti]
MSITYSTFLISLGTALLLLAHRLHRTGALRHYAVFQRYPPLQDIIPIFIVFCSLWLVVCSLAVVIAQNKGAVLSLLGVAQQGQGDGGLSTVVAILGIVMVLVTAVVFSVSKDAVDRLEKEKEHMEERYRGIKEQMEERYRGIEAEASELQLTNLRLYAYQENELELRNARVNSDDGNLAFRTFLSSVYHQTESKWLLDLLRKLERKLGDNDGLELLSIDKGYLGKVRDHYRTYPAAENAAEIAKTADRILTRWEAV